MATTTIIAMLVTFIVGYVLGYESAWKKAQREARALVALAKRMSGGDHV